MQRRIDRHNWFEEYGDLISTWYEVPEHSPDFPWSQGFAEAAFHRLAYNREDNDCGVRALAVACAAPYDEAHEALSQAGRIDGESCMVPQMLWAAGVLKCAMHHTSCTAKTLLTVERELKHTRGGFIVTTTSHAAGIWDGELIDHARGRLWRLDGIYRIESLRSKIS